MIHRNSRFRTRFPRRPEHLSAAEAEKGSPAKFRSDFTIDPTPEETFSGTAPEKHGLPQFPASQTNSREITSKTGHRTSATIHNYGTWPKPCISLRCRFQNIWGDSGCADNNTGSPSPGPHCISCLWSIGSAPKSSRSCIPKTFAGPRCH